MDRNTKIQFEPQELAVIQDPLPFEVRQQVMPKLTNLLSQWMETLKSQPAYQSFPYPSGTDTKLGNIARGERLQGCPYLIADLPRLFHSSGHFAFRTLFWWGHHFTFFWHLSGTHASTFGKRILSNLDQLPPETKVSFSENEWEHNVSASNYHSIDGLDQGFCWQEAEKSGFLKLALPLSLDRWAELNAVGLDFYERSLKAMSA